LTAEQQTLAASEQVRQRIAAMPEVQRIFTVVGNGNDVRQAEVSIVWKPASERDALTDELQTRAVAATADLPGIATFQTGTQDFTYTFEATDPLQYACIVPGHYAPMHGDFEFVE
jgi:hypothetical protein